MASSAHPSGFPTLEAAYIITVNVGEGHVVGNVFSGSSLTYFPLVGGSIRTVPGFEPKIDAEVILGGDSLYFDPDKEHGRLNVKGIAKTIEGTALSFTHTGTIHVNDEIRLIISGSSEAHTIPFGQATTTVTFEVGDARYKDLEKKTWVGNGRFVIEGGKLVAESRVSMVIPSTAMN